MKTECIRVVMGVDVSMDKLDICIIEVTPDLKQKIKGTRSFVNSKKGVEALCGYWRDKSRHNPNAYVVMEPTGTYHENLAYELYERGFRVCIELANKIKHFSKSLNIKTKTDKSDAMVIARYGAQQDLAIWQPFSENERTLKQLTRLNLTIKGNLIAAKNRMHALKATDMTHEDVLQFVEQEIEFLTQYVKKISEQIEGVIASDKELNRKMEIIKTIPGVSTITAATVIAETGGFQTFSNARSLVSYAGLDVTHNESGTIKKKTYISKRGNSRLRTALFMPSLSTATHAKTLASFYERIIDRHNGQMKKVGLTAVMRKLLVLIYTLWKSEEVYDPHYIHVTQRSDKSLAVA